MKIADVLRALESHAPVSSAEAWDNVGLLVGDQEWECPGVVVDVDLSLELVDRAIAEKAGVIVVHHPPIFKGVQRLVAHGPDALATLLLRAARHQIGVIACHTNFDRHAIEVATAVAKGLGCELEGRLMDSSSDVSAAVKLVVFVPETHLEKVQVALAAAGAGALGWYDSCAYGVAGKGTFRPLGRAVPHVGEKNKLESVAEVRLETLVPRAILPGVLSAMRAAHPYEEVAFDVIPVEQELPTAGLHRGLGYGFLGSFATPVAFSDFVSRVGRVFGIDVVRATGKPRDVSRLGFLSGKGSSFVSPALAARCDLFLVGELTYHESLRALRSGMTVLELGHAQSERFFAPTVGKWLEPLALKTLCLNHGAQRSMSIGE